MSDAAAFLAKIIAEPDDDLPRLVYADFLDERGDPRGEFVRVQCELAGIIERECICPRPMNLAAQPPQDCPRCLRWSALRRRERELIGKHHPKWFAGLPGFWWCGNCLEPSVDYGTMYRPRATFTRGFVGSVTLSWADFQTHADALLRSCPIRRVNRGKACTRCRSGIIPHSDDVPCEYCRGTGRVDDWRGDGVVRLTTWPEWETPRTDRPGPYDDDRLRFPGRDWHPIPFNGRDPLPPGQMRQRITLALLAAEYGPGVHFELPEPRSVDGLTAREVAERMNAATADRPTGDKAIRLEPFAAQAGAGNVRLVTAPWNREYIEELTTFPAARHDDQVDATAGAFNLLAGVPQYDRPHLPPRSETNVVSAMPADCFRSE